MITDHVRHILLITVDILLLDAHASVIIGSQGLGYACERLRACNVVKAGMQQDVTPSAPVFRVCSDHGSATRLQHNIKKASSHVVKARLLTSTVQIMP